MTQRHGGKRIGEGARLRHQGNSGNEAPGSFTSPSDRESSIAAYSVTVQNCSLLEKINNGTGLGRAVQAVPLPIPLGRLVNS